MGWWHIQNWNKRKTKSYFTPWRRWLSLFRIFLYHIISVWLFVWWVLLQLQPKSSKSPLYLVYTSWIFLVLLFEVSFFSVAKTDRQFVMEAISFIEWEISQWTFALEWCLYIKGRIQTVYIRTAAVKVHKINRNAMFVYMLCTATQYRKRAENTVWRSF